jgi:hypothetical protein
MNCKIIVVRRKVLKTIAANKIMGWKFIFDLMAYYKK